MAKFFVGQRVRVCCPQSPLGNHGKETTITRLCVDVLAKFAPFAYIGHEVDLPSPNPVYPRCVYEPHELIPIVDHHQPCDADFKESLDSLLDPLTRPCKGEVTNG